MNQNIEESDINPKARYYKEYQWRYLMDLGRQNKGIKKEKEMTAFVEYDNTNVEEYKKILEEHTEVENAVMGILDERAKTHGEFENYSKLYYALQMAFRQGCESSLSVSQFSALDMILSKIARIGNGNPDFIDHWDDIAGYATLVANILRKEANND